MQEGLQLVQITPSRIVVDFNIVRHPDDQLLYRVCLMVFQVALCGAVKTKVAAEVVVRYFVGIAIFCRIGCIIQVQLVRFPFTTTVNILREQKFKGDLS